MEHNKQYNSRKIVRLSMLMAMLVLSSLFTTTLRASHEVLSLQDSSQSICHYFKVIPSKDCFEGWVTKVRKVVADYALEKELKSWLQDIKTLEKIIAPFDDIDRVNMDFAALVKQYQEKAPSGYSMICAAYPKPLSDEQSGKLLSIGKLSPGEYVNINPVIAVVDELNRESMRAHEGLSIAKSRRLAGLCLNISQIELGKNHKMVKLQTPPSLKDIISIIVPWGASQPEKGNKND